MSGTRRDILISGLSSTAVFAVSSAAGAETVKVGRDGRTLAGVEKVGYTEATASGVCGRCLYFQSKANEAFATCPMFSRASRWHERIWCSAFDEKA
jgi:High potential iron-sulfur protein